MKLIKAIQDFEITVTGGFAIATVLFWIGGVLDFGRYLFHLLIK